MSYLKFPVLKTLYAKGKPLCQLKFNKGVRSASPRVFEVLRAIRFASKCEAHKAFTLDTVLFCRSGDYTDFIGPGIYIGTRNDELTGLIFGQMNAETCRAFASKTQGKLGCGCILKRIPDQEVSELVNNKEFTCSYANGHLVDER